MKLTQTLIIATVLAALSCTASANQAALVTVVITDVDDGIICNSFPTCPRGGNEEEPPAKSS